MTTQKPVTLAPGRSDRHQAQEPRDRSARRPRPRPRSAFGRDRQRDRLPRPHARLAGDPCRLGALARLPRRSRRGRPPQRRGLRPRPGRGPQRSPSRREARRALPRRFGSAYAPLDEALARAVVDLSGRAYCRADLALGGARLGDLAGENAVHFFWSLASAAKMTLHVDVLAGENSHHKAEAAFKALALALREACGPPLPRRRARFRRDRRRGRTRRAPSPRRARCLLEEIDEADWLARLRG